MDRRIFLQSATLVATTAGAATSMAAAAPAATAETTSVPQGKPVGEPVTRRWLEQRWIIDNVIKANGIDWDQPHSVYLNSPCGFDADGDFAAIRQRVQIRGHLLGVRGRRAAARRQGA